MLDGICEERPERPGQGVRLVAAPGTRTPHRASGDRLEALYGPLACGVTVHDASGALIYMNAAARRMAGASFSELCTAAASAGLPRLLRPDGTPLPCAEWPPLVALRTNCPVHAVVFGVLHADGSCRWLQADAVPIAGADGRTAQVVSSFSDVTALREAEGELHALAAIVAGSEDAILSFRLDGVLASWNPGAERLYGYSAAEAIGRRLDFLMPAEARPALDRLLKSIARGRPLRNYDAPVITKAGLRREVSAIISPLRDASGQVVAAAAIVRDVTAQRRAEARLQASEQRHRELFEQASDMIYTIDLAGRLLSVNEATLRLTGYTRAELLGRNLDELIVPEDAPRAAAMARLRLAGEPAGAYEVEIVSRDGRRLALEVNAQVIYENGEAVAMQAIARDIGARRLAEAELKHQALHDALTGLPNRTLLYDRLRQGILAAARDAEPLALLFLDLDRFKAVNDSLGHLAGDQLLRLVAARLAGTLRESDTLARLGGDEFAVLLPGTGAHGAEVAAGKIRRAFAEPFALEGQQLQIGASTGVAAFPHHGAEAEALLRCADIAMYMAKRAGGGIAVYSLEQNVRLPA